MTLSENIILGAMPITVAVISGIVGYVKEKDDSEKLSSSIFTALIGLSISFDIYIGIIIILFWS